MFEDAYKRQPHNEELALQTFYAYVRTGNWKAGQQVRGNCRFMNNDWHFGSACHQNEQAVLS